MKRIINFVFSTRLMAVLILAFAISIAVATFIENDFGTQTARAVVYNSWWFNALLFAGIINLTGTIISARLYRREKLTIFAFHLAFLLILTGAAVTRFFGFEGYMHIREGHSSGQIVSSDNYFTMSVNLNGEENGASKKVHFSSLSRNYHKLNVHAGNREFTAECLNIVPDAIESAIPDASGVPVIEWIVSGSQGRQNIVVTSNAPRMFSDMTFSLNDILNDNGVNILSGDTGLYIRSPFDFTVTQMSTGTTDTLSKGRYHPLRLMMLYNFNGLLAVPGSYLQSGTITVKPDENSSSEEMPDAVLIRVSSGNQSRTIRYFATENSLNEPVNLQLDGASIDISFGSIVVPVPFQLHLTGFILERYPGSNSPSWFESRIVLNDQKAGVNENRRVYMNNVLKYRGYRFYQSSYDTDEKGTVFSVNRDLAGTLITYAGYLLLAAGIILSLLNRNSRFRKLSSELKYLRKSGNQILAAVVLLVIPIANSNSQIPDSVHIDASHAAAFGELLIQDPGGRIKPVNTLSSELMRKVSGKTSVLGQNPDQVLLGMLAWPDFWQDVPMIRVGHPGIKKLLQSEESRVSFASAFNFNSPENPYILGPYVNEAYQKKPAARSTFDTEVIRIDERINLCYQIYTGNLLRIFPAANDPRHSWYSPVNQAGVFSENDSIFTSSIIPLYIRSLSGDKSVQMLMTPGDALSAIHKFQRNFGSEVIPSDFRIRLEILYNRMNLFDRIGNAYGLIGMLLLILQFVSVFYHRLNIRPAFRTGRFLIYVLFVLHLTGLIARWIISGHAPWSNGYEALVYISFATVLAGILFSSKSQIALSVTAILAWLILFVAHLNWMDPEITNLVPVLKSYWLLIHVAIITASYGFLAMGALMAFTNLLLMIVQNRKNQVVTGRMITELSIIIEMTLIVGLYMLTIGTFLGGVWANESWGRYWGWDPKETWALVSILVYAFVAHMRLVPGLKGNFSFNLFALLSFSTIIMTYFGVNYYLSGLHSYAKGDPLPVPPFVYYTIAIVGLVALLAWENQRRLKKAGLIAGLFQQKHEKSVTKSGESMKGPILN